MSPALLELTDEEREALTRFLRDAIERDRFPLSPRLATDTRRRCEAGAAIYAASAIGRA